MLPEFANAALSPSNNKLANNGSDTLMTATSNTTIVEEDQQPNTSDDEDSDRPMTKAELLKRAAKTMAGFQVNSRLQPNRVKPSAQKKKKIELQSFKNDS